MADIFVSYSKEDAERARQLVQHLSAQGWSVSWDRNVPPGKQWREVLEADKQLREILRDLEDVGADAVDHLPEHMKDFADHLRMLAVELLMQDDTQAALEITEQIVDHARARYSRLPEGTPSQQRRKNSALAEIAGLARKLGLRDR